MQCTLYYSPGFLGLAETRYVCTSTCSFEGLQNGGMMGHGAPFRNRRVSMPWLIWEMRAPGWGRCSPRKAIE